jgi:hypothetical protein
MPRAPSTEITELRRLAGHALHLSEQVSAVDNRLAGAGDEPTRRAGYRLDDVASNLLRVANELTAAVDELTRIANRGTCAADWGLCPEHGNTLTSSGGRSWCRRPGCRRRWDYDRGGLPCTEPAAYRVRDNAGGESQLCTGHANDACQRLTGARLIPLRRG